MPAKTRQRKKSIHHHRGTPLFSVCRPTPRLQSKKSYGVYHFPGKTRDKGIHHRPRKKGIHHKAVKVRDHMASRGSSQKVSVSQGFEHAQYSDHYLPSLHHLSKSDFTHHLIWVSSFHSLSGILGSPLLSLSSSRVFRYLTKASDPEQEKRRVSTVVVYTFFFPAKKVVSAQGWLPCRSSEKNLIWCSVENVEDFS